MHPNSVSSTGEGQSPIDLSACDAAAFSGTRFKLLSPIGELHAQLELQFDVRRRLAELRDRTTKGIRFAQEVFGQSHAIVGQTSDGNLVVLICSVLATATKWQGGWFVVTVPPDDVENFAAYLRASQTYTVANLRKENVQRTASN